MEFLRRSFGIVSFLGVALFLAACDENQIITRVDRTVVYDKMLVQHTASGGKMPVVILGSPVPGGAAEADIADQLGLPGRFPPATFQPVAADSLPEAGHLVLLYNAPDNVNANRVCAEETRYPTAAAAGPGFTVFAFFCLDSKWVARGHLRLREVDGLDDPRFADGMTTLFNVMFPQKGEQDMR